MAAGEFIVSDRAIDIMAYMSSTFLDPGQGTLAQVLSTLSNLSGRTCGSLHIDTKPRLVIDIIDVLAFFRTLLPFFLIRDWRL